MASFVDSLSIMFCRAARTAPAIIVAPLASAVMLSTAQPVLAAAAKAADVPPGVRMHRSQAGKPDKAGWVDAASTEGGFTAALPCRFNDFAFEDTSEGSRTRRTDTLGCATPNGRRFSATRVAYRGGAKDAEAFFKRGKTEPPWRGATQRIATFHGRSVVDSVFEDGRRCGYMRMVHAAPENFLLVVEAPKVACGGLAPVSRKFFDSLVIRSR